MPIIFQWSCFEKKEVKKNKHNAEYWSPTLVFLIQQVWGEADTTSPGTILWEPLH